MHPKFLVCQTVELDGSALGLSCHGRDNHFALDLTIMNASRMGVSISGPENTVHGASRVEISGSRGLHLSSDMNSIQGHWICQLSAASSNGVFLKSSKRNIINGNWTIHSVEDNSVGTSARF